MGNINEQNQERGATDSSEMNSQKSGNMNRTPSLSNEANIETGNSQRTDVFQQPVVSNPNPNVSNPNINVQVDMAGRNAPTVVTSVPQQNQIDTTRIDFNSGNSMPFIKTDTLAGSSSTDINASDMVQKVPYPTNTTTTTLTTTQIVPDRNFVNEKK